MRRTTLTALAVLAAALGLAACGGSETSTEPSPATTEEPAAPAATTETARAATTETAQPGTTATTQPETTVTQPADTAASVRVNVKGGQPVGGPKELTVSKGDRVTIEVSVDAPDTIHVHGYDIEAEAAPGAPAVIELTADLEGVFDVESHTTEALLVKLVVEP